MADMQVGNIHAWDLVVIVLYLAGSLALGIYTIAKSKASIQDMFLAGRTMTWWPIGFSLFASNIGATNYVGIAGDAAASGYAVIMFEWNAVYLLILLGWIFLPVYIASGIYTMPEYLAWRFGGKRLQIYLSVVALITYIFATVSADLYSGAVFINQSLGLNIYVGVAILLAIALIFNGFGGLETVLITDSLAVVVMMIGGIILCGIGFAKVGGLQALEWKYMRAVPNTTLYSNSTCGHPPDDALHIFRHPWNSSYPSVGLILRTTLGSLWYWCANQVLVQRALAAKNITHAKAGCLFASYLKLMPFFIMVFPGMISRTLYPDEVACADPESCMKACGSEVGCTNIALPKLVMGLLPTGLKGLMVASVIAAVVSSLTSIFNSSSAIFTMDIWSNIRKAASEREKIIVGRLFVLVLVGVSIMWIPLMSQAEGGKIFTYATTITGYIGAPTCAMFILAMFWTRINEQGAFWGMLIAQAWGMVRFILDMIYPAPACGLPDNRPKIVADFHAYYHTVSQILLAFIIAAAVSWATEVPDKTKLGGLTYWTRFKKPQRDKDMEERRRIKEALTKDRIIEHTDTLLFNTTDNLLDKEESTNVRNTENEDSIKYLGLSHRVSSLPDEEKEERLHETDEVKEVDVPEVADVSVEVDESVVTPLTIPQRFIRLLCGGKKKDDDDDEEILEDHSLRVASIKQTVSWDMLLNINAAIMLCITAFLYGFFY